MLPAPAQLYKCPHCGKTKPMLSLMSGNTFGGELWSDGRAIYPMLPKLSTIQKCSYCGRYSLLDKWKDTGKTSNESCGETGGLTYAEAKEAYVELSSSTSDASELSAISISFVQAYNDQFRRPRLRKAYQENKPIDSISGFFGSPKMEDIHLVIKATKQAIETLDDSENNRLLKAELLRELGRRDEALRILRTITNIDVKWIVDILTYHIALWDNRLLPLVIDGKKVDYSCRANYATIVANKAPDRVEVDRSIERFVQTLSSEIRQDTKKDALSGVYDKSTKSLLKVVTPCAKHFEIENQTYHICDYALFRNFVIKSLAFSRNLRSIGAKALYDCKNLEMVSPNNAVIESIGDCAFMNCKSLKEIGFIDNVLFLGRSVFAGMDKLESIRLPQKINRIPEFTFFECESLQHVEIPKSVNVIESYSFQHTAIKHLTIPENVQELGDAVFSRCFQLEYVKLPNGLKIIPERTFSSCKSLREIVIPKSVKTIMKEAFDGTESLTTVRFRGKVEQIDETAFKDSGLETAIVPFWTESHYKKLFPNLTIKTEIP
ncbi:MAG: leucine-rich repeat domain-containing protein [Prevotella sp.]|nr:leucine-rich repeat domain-containing protein [Prevotella sp.]